MSHQDEKQSLIWYTSLLTRLHFYHDRNVCFISKEKVAQLEYTIAQIKNNIYLPRRAVEQDKNFDNLADF